MINRVIRFTEERLSSLIGTTITVLDHRKLGGGCINHAQQIKTNAGDFFLKWNDQGPEDLFIREAEGLSALRSAGSCLRIPKVMFVTSPGDDLPGMLLTEFLPPLSGKRNDQDEQLGRGIAQIHDHTHTAYGFEHDTYCGSTRQNNQWNDDWVEFFGQQRIWYLINLIEGQRNLSGHEHQAYEQLISKLPELISHQPAASLNHGDLWSGNYMYSQVGPALIDPASYYADREFDLALMAMFGGFSDRVWEAYQEVAPLPPEWTDRVALYQLYHYLNHYFLFGGHYGQQALAIARKFI